MPNRIIERQNEVIHNMVVRHVMSYVAPITFGLAPGRDVAGEATQNASCSLLEINGRRLLITNDHVLEGYEDIAAHPRARLQIGDAEPIAPSIIDRDHDLDLAVLDAADLHPSEIAERGGRIPFWSIRPSHWPLDPVKKGELVCFGGWPQKYRRGENGERILTNASWSLSATAVTEVSDDRFICVLERETWQSAFSNVGDGLSTTELGGLSGCPAFVLRELSYEYVGVLYEYSPNLDTIFFRHTQSICADGTLKRG